MLVSEEDKELTFFDEESCNGMTGILRSDIPAPVALDPPLSCTMRVSACPDERRFSSLMSHNTFHCWGQVLV